jgi:GT2 family glycosyltransferase
MNEARGPELSVILVTPDSYATVRTTIRYLLRQETRNRIELILVVPRAEELKPDVDDLEGFLAYQIVEVGPIQSIAYANGAGIRRARAPVVALAEDHAFPAPGWAEALLKAHQSEWAAVGPVVRNANPRSIVSWADLLIAYAPWLHPGRGGHRDHLPGHNSSYKRDILLGYGADLEAMLEAESVLHWDLRQKGYRLHLEPAAQIAHLNFGRLSSWVQAQFYSGRVFAASRARPWNPGRRALYALASPLIPFVRLWRIVEQTRESGSWEKVPRGVLPMLLLGLFVSALGEFVGYVAGPGEARPKLAEFEFHRVRHLGVYDPRDQPV